MDNTMTPRNGFILGLRLFGIWQLTYTIWDAFTAFTIIKGFYRPGTGSAKQYIVMTFMHFLLAAWLLKFAPQTARVFYPEPPRDEDISDEKPSGSTPTI